MSSAPSAAAQAQAAADLAGFERREIAAVGDSHALYAFGYCQDVDVYWLGPRLMHRVARDGLRSLITLEDLGFFGERHLASYRAILLSFGEIDARSHLPRIAAERAQSLEVAAADVTGRFIDSLAAQDLLPWDKVLLAGAPAPSALFLSPEEIQAQLTLRRAMNDGLRAGAARLGCAYLPPADALIDADGVLASRYDLDGVHTNYDGAAISTGLLTERVGLPRRLESRDIDILQMTVANRHGFG
ncbi:MAG: SGNH/GDSL hydrolase family protein [Pseudomonadota bacterium]